MTSPGDASLTANWMVLQGVTLVQQPAASTPVASSTKHVAAGHAGAAHCAPAVDALAKSRAPTRPRTRATHRFPAVMFVTPPVARLRVPRPPPASPALLPCQGKVAMIQKETKPGRTASVLARVEPPANRQDPPVFPSALESRPLARAHAAAATLDGCLQP